MTREEAKEIIKEARFDINTKINGTTIFLQALEIAIEASEQQPCDDVISRADARHLIAETNRKSLCYISSKVFKILYDGIDKLPSVTLQQKWIPVSEPPKTDGRYLTYIVNDFGDSRFSPLSYIMVCDYINKSWCPDDETASNNVTHWMPLPVEPYEEEKQ